MYVHKKTKPKKFIYLGLMKFYKTEHNFRISNELNETCIIPLPETFYFNDVFRTETETGEGWTIRLLLQPLVSGVDVSLLVSWLTVDILRTFCGVFVVRSVKVMLRISEFRVLLFDCFVYCQNVTSLKRFTTYGHYAGEVEGINRCAKN